VIENVVTARFIERVAEAKRRGIWTTVQPEVWQAIREHDATLSELLLADEVAAATAAMLSIPKADTKRLAESVLTSRATVGVQTIEAIFARLDSIKSMTGFPKAAPERQAA
jgi:hypothetical protein